MSIFSLLAARSVSIFATPGVREPLLEVGPQREILVEQLRVVAIGEPARLPRLVEPEPESVRMNFLTHSRTSFNCRGAPPPRPVPSRLRFGATCFWSPSALLRRRCLLACRRRAPSPARPPSAAGFAFASRLRGSPRFGAAPGADGRNLQRPLRHVHGQVRGALHDAERAAHRGGTDALHRRPLIGVARRHEQAIDVAAESFLLLRVGDRRAQQLRDVVADALARELQRRERAVHVASADQVHHEPGLLGRRADVTSCRVRFNRHD